MPRKLEVAVSQESLLLAHLSRRLTGELIGYPWIRRPASSSVCINGPGHMTKMAAMPIYGKYL